MIVGSFMGTHEIELSMGGIINSTAQALSIPLLPKYPLIKPYKELLLYSEKFYQMFWNSCIQTFLTTILQIIVAAPAAWVLSIYEFHGRKLLFWIYIIVMLLPFQVLMVSEYIILNQLSLLNSHWSIILPGMFSAYPVFILTRVYKSISTEVIEAARLDGTNFWSLFTKIGLPLAKSGILSVFILGFLEYWNAIEQPLIFIKNKELWPLALFFPEINIYNAGSVFAASIIITIPTILIFLNGDEYLESGIKAYSIKQ